ncbi:unnamed protein product [Lupinus luteus]|uniref:Uncharacterized protein n=1 Tax=Lupinus luteus TaxID=3873 RepID=A0AAV1W893_LUPLU
MATLSIFFLFALLATGSLGQSSSQAPTHSASSPTATPTAKFSPPPQAAASPKATPPPPSKATPPTSTAKSPPPTSHSAPPPKTTTSPPSSTPDSSEAPTTSSTASPTDSPPAPPTSSPATAPAADVSGVSEAPAEAALSPGPSSNTVSLYKFPGGGYVLSATVAAVLFLMQI